MRILLFKHFDFDDESVITRWAARKGHTTQTLLIPQHDGVSFPPVAMEAFDMLVVLGGPMSAYQEDTYSWLKLEKQFLCSAVSRLKPVLGICLGAQLLAEALGGSVYRNEFKEIGWHPVRRTSVSHPLFEGIPEQFYSFHWHGDRFDPPADAVPLAYSEACGAQAFAYGEHVLGLQFHLETTSSCMGMMLERWENELVEAPYIQKAEHIRKEMHRCADSAALLQHLLERLEQAALKPRAC